ncbi:hypothetical protein OG21DRAFT_1526801 [Imleria badia]|nr:hypothetical protein OG21DRAFT_1526801 [Imleria badia]
MGQRVFSLIISVDNDDAWVSKPTPVPSTKLRLSSVQIRSQATTSIPAMAKATRQKRPSVQTQNKNGTSTDVCKRAKTAVSGDVLDPDSQATRRSARSNIGKGGQMAQLENIECVQTQRSARTSKLMVATLDEPLNPMAPVPSNARSRTSKASSGDMAHNLHFHASARHPTLPIHQASMEGSRYGFGVPLEPEGKSQMSMQEPHPPRPFDVPLSASHSHTCPTTASMTASTPRYGSVAPAPPSRSSTHPLSRAGSTAPTSWAGSTTPASRIESTPPTSHSGSIAHSTSRPESTHSCVHSFEELTHQMETSLGGSRPPAYQSRTIPEDEDVSRISQAAPELNRCNRPCQTSNHDIDPAILSEECRRHHFNDTVIDPDLLAQERSNDAAAHDIVNDYHQRNCFPHPPDPSHLHESRSSNSRGSGAPPAIPAGATSGPPSQALVAPAQALPFKAPMCRQNGKRVPRRLKLDPRELQRHSKVQGLDSKGFQGSSTPTPRPQPQSETDPYSMPSNRVSSPFQARAWFQAAPTGSSTPMPSNQVPSSFQDKIKIGR